MRMLLEGGALAMIAAFTYQFGKSDLMQVIKWILGLALVVALVVVYNLPLVKIKRVYSNYRSAPGLMAKDRVIKDGKKGMQPSLLPFILQIYSEGVDVKFAESMVNSCRGIEANNTLKEISREQGVDPMIRTICLAHLLSRDRLEAWSEITEQDIDSICNSPPHHVVFWKTLLLRNTGYTYRAFNGDVHPVRRRFRKVFHECIDMYEERQLRKKMRNNGIGIPSGQR
jgi:hypothetical protein